MAGVALVSACTCGSISLALTTGAGKQWREKSEVEAVVQKVAARLKVTSVYIDHIAYRPECKERYTCGQYHIKRVEC